jgi:PqqD family protein of HPr-rel-A system
MPRLNDNVALHWHHWDREFVVFDEGSGRTHQLDALNACALLCIEDGCSDFDVLAARFAQHMSLDRASAMKALPPILDQLRGADLIE